jgi:HAD superfamily hydrolase (TIGR01509 family)
LGVIELDTVAQLWQLALDADERALDAGSAVLLTPELVRLRADLLEERRTTEKELAQLAEATRTRPGPWLSPVAITPKMIGLPERATACLFDLDGVLTNSGVLHARAWATAFDGFLQTVAERNGWHFIPFDGREDYLAYVDGRPRLEGVRAFLESRGIHVPVGEADDPAGAETAYGLARRKADALARNVHDRGVAALRGARRYLEATGHAGLERGIVSASANARAMLEAAGLGSLVEDCLDAEAMQVEHLRPRPEPDVLLAAAGHVGADPARTVTFTSSPSGVKAGVAAGMVVVGIGEGARGERLRALGAEQVVPSLRSLLDRRLR